MILRSVGGIAQLPAAAWDRLVGPSGSPFLEHRFLHLLEESGSASDETGWYPQHLTLWDGEELVGAAPTYVKTHSMGEFVYDWAWAHAARQMGAAYYPKVVVGVPFTPATGQRLLTAPDRPRDPLLKALVGGLHELSRATGCHGVHVLFPTEAETAALEPLGGATRLQFQFHWEDAGYGDFEGFLARMKTKRRGELRRERRRLAETGVVCKIIEGDELRDEHMEQMRRFYVNTADRFGGEIYLNDKFWAGALHTLRDRLQLVFAYDGARPIAGALNIKKGDRLYGRYWGFSAEVPFLHFEVCYYQPIEYCLKHGLVAFEPGHGGGHKYPRGFEPRLCRSSHWLTEPRFDRAIRETLRREREAVLTQTEELLAASPLAGD